MVKLSMPVALLIEAAIAGGVAGNQLVEVIRTKNMEALRHIGKEEKSWSNFFEYAEQNWDTIVSAINSGYTIKFLTIRGLTNLIRTKFSLKENNDFVMGESFIDLTLTQEQLDFLLAKIPLQWKFTKQDNDRYNYRAVLSQTKQNV
ncbi:hypothetical protein [Fictibacillus barbaricus]|uniref:Uncharacterized protein n=1 Tax=Fictibacillus barbaricus TaxID=182136 RepID=A0ABS2ZBL3_9BACL|nr:hypothetical protein [Fictibacillus barbaricus]MBN3545588.1 hypothetical protein [Fictibacillus barbaricus]GGB54583.1 hypothetical protein GCM10007199_20430 [Fictibacillus barbaricus]